MICKGGIPEISIIRIIYVSANNKVYISFSKAMMMTKKVSASIFALGSKVKKLERGAY